MDIIGKNFPRINLAHLPTPFDEASNLSSFLRGPRIFFKRDDLTGLSCGGNKIRKLEFLIAYALEKKADYVVTGGGTQSNHACQTASVCNKSGLKVRLVLKKPDEFNYQGNLLLEKLMGADIKFVEVKKLEELEEAMKRECEDLAGKGHNPYYIPMGGSNYLGVLAYALSMKEIMAQAGERNLKTDRIVTACGTGGTIAGLILGKRLLDLNCNITGISVGATDNLKDTISAIVSEGAQAINFRCTCHDDINIYYDYVGPSYGEMTPATKEAIEIVAKTEGIFLDPVYTGKAMAGLIDFIRKGLIGKDETIVFLHTGGLPAIFAYKRELLL